MTNKEIIQYLVDYNDYKYNLLKTAEELQELSLVLTQMALKEVIFLIIRKLKNVFNIN